MAADTLKIKRGTSAQVAAYLPELGEPVWDKESGRLSVGDGVNSGGKQVSEVISISGYGAKGDGGLTNNRAAIAAAIAANPGKSILVPVDRFGGQYAVTSGTLTLPDTTRLVYEYGAVIYASGGVVTNISSSFSIHSGYGGFSSNNQRFMSTKNNDGSSGAQFNSIIVDRDHVPTTGKVDGLFIRHQYGDAGTRGGRHALEAFLIQRAATATDNPDRNYAALAGSCHTPSGDGGSASAGYLGAYFGGNLVAKNLGAQYIYNLSGCEFNTTTVDLGGNEVLIHTGLQVASHHDKRGTVVDTALFVSSRAGSLTTWSSGIRFDNQNGAYPLGSDSKVLVCRTASNTLLSGFELPQCTSTILSSGNVNLQDNKLTMSGVSANIELGSTATAGVPFLDFHSSGLPNDYDVRVSSAGGTATIGQGTLVVDALEVSSSATLRPTTDITRSVGTTTRRWLNGFIQTLRPGTGTVIWTSGAGTPEGVVTAAVGSMYTRTDGGALTTLYIKESGTGNTGWVAK